MSPRWKSQIAHGIAWMLLMTIFTTLSEMKEKGLAAQFAEPRLWISAALHLACGVFIIGYIQWKYVEKRKPGT